MVREYLKENRGLVRELEKLGYSVHAMRQKDGRVWVRARFLLGGTELEAASGRDSDSKAHALRNLIDRALRHPDHQRFLERKRLDAANRARYLADKRAGRRENPGRPKYSSAAASRYKQFHGHDVRNVHQLRVKPTRELVCLGDAVEIVYRSDKLNGGGDGKLAEYQHKFARGTKLYCTPDGRHVLYIHGNKLRVRAPGIIN